MYAIAALTNYQGPSCDPDSVPRVRRRAQVLAQLLQDGEMLQKERINSLNPNRQKPPGRDGWWHADPKAPQEKTLPTWRTWANTIAAPHSPSPSIPIKEAGQMRGRSPANDHDDHDDDISEVLGSEYVCPQLLNGKEHSHIIECE